MRPMVSVIVPVFNAGDHLHRCLESITTQTYPDLETVVVDDGSTDGSRNLIAEWELPYRNPLGIVYDNGAYARVMDAACRLGDWTGFPARAD